MHQLAEFAQLVATQSVVYGIAFHQILFEDSIGPLAEFHTTLTLYAIAYGDDDIECIKGDRLLHTINTQKMRVVLFLQFTFGKYIVYMLSDCLFITFKSIAI